MPAPHVALGKKKKKQRGPGLARTHQHESAPVGLVRVAAASEEMPAVPGRQLAEWNEAHTGEANPEKPKEKHKFTYGKACAELNTDRFDDPEKVETDNWVGGFYMEVYVDGWDVDKTITLDFHTPDIEFPKHACQNVRVVGYSETTVTLVVVQQRWICCESFGCALRGTRPERITFTCGTLGSPPPSPPPLPAPPPPPSPPRPRPPPPPSPPPPPRKIYPPAPPPPPIMRVTEQGIIDNGYGANDPNAFDGGASLLRFSPPPVAGAGGARPSGRPEAGGLAGMLGVTEDNLYFGGGLLALGAIAYYYLSSRNLLPWVPHKGEATPQSDMAKLVRAEPKKVDVRVEVLGVEEGMLEIATKGLTSVTELGERLAEEMVTQLYIEDAFKLYYVDAEGDTMLVSAHTALRDLIYSEQITAKVDDYALPFSQHISPTIKSSVRGGDAPNANWEVAWGDPHGEAANAMVPTASQWLMLLEHSVELAKERNVATVTAEEFEAMIEAISKSQIEAPTASGALGGPGQRQTRPYVRSRLNLEQAHGSKQNCI